MKFLLSSLYIPCHIHREYLIRRTSAFSDIKSYKYKGISMGYWFVLVRVIKFGNHPGLMDSTLRVVKGKRQGGGAGGGGGVALINLVPRLSHHRRGG